MDADSKLSACPYPGLRPFDSGESHLFFGRDGQADQLIDRLRRTRFLTVLGTSGSGKSSLVRAGLLPALFAGLMREAGSRWRIAILHPGGNPLGNLAGALTERDVFNIVPQANHSVRLAMVDAALRRGRRGLVEIAEQASLESHENLLIVVDEFETLFRFRAGSAGGSLQEEAADFVKLLLEASRQWEIPIYVVLVLRSDFIGDCSVFWGLPEAINNGLFSIPRMNRDQLREAISGPVAVAGGEITPRLINRLLNDVGDSFDQLPILQQTLMRVWECWTKSDGKALDLEHYQAIGTMAESLSRHADEAIEELSIGGQKLAEVLFKALTELGTDNREIRRPTTIGEVCTIAGASEAEVAEVVNVFRRGDRSFLMPPPEIPLHAETLIDISHESLIRNWRRLRDWVAQESNSARIYKRLAETAVLYQMAAAGLWRNPDLQVALNWRDRAKPNEAWARRYHPEFSSAMEFLDASVKAQDAELRESEERRLREIKRSRQMSLVMLILFVLALGAFIFAYTKSL